MEPKAEAVSTGEGRDMVIRAINSLIDKLEKGPEMLDRGILNLLGIEGLTFTSDFESRRLIEVGNAFLALIAGQIQADASSTEFMPGSNVSEPSVRGSTQDMMSNLVTEGSPNAGEYQGILWWFRT